MKRNYYISVIWMALSIALCIGCTQKSAGDETGVTGSAVSGGAAGNITESAVSVTTVTGSTVSGTAVTDSVVSRKTSTKKYLYANSTNAYRDAVRDYYGDDDYWDEDDEVKEGIIQYKRTGEKQETFDNLKMYASLLGVTEEGVYYARFGDSVEVCRIPIEKNANGTDRLKQEATEVLFVEENGIKGYKNAYVDENYIVYISAGDYVVQYNRKTGEKAKVGVSNNLDRIVAVGQGYLMIINSEGGYLKLDLDLGELRQFDGGADTYLSEDYALYAVELYKDQFFFKKENPSYYYRDEIWVYDVKKQEKQVLLSEKQLRKACRQVPVSSIPLDIKEIEYTRCCLQNMFCQRDRLYMQVQMELRGGGKSWESYAIFSMDISNLNGSGMDKVKLKYEKNLTDCMWSHSDSKFDKGDAWNTGIVVAMRSGKAVLVLNQKGTKQKKFGCYDLKTERFYEITEEDEEYCALYYNTKEPFGKGDYYLKEKYITFEEDEDDDIC